MREDLLKRYPTLFHMTAAGSWTSIRKHGLLSTRALLDLFEVHGAARERLLTCKREECQVLDHPVHGRATVRDQKPLIESKLVTSLRDGLSLRDWYSLLSDRVFFWLCRDRLEGLLGARAYRDGKHEVLIVDAAGLIHDHAGSIELSAMNTGNTQPIAHPRGRNTFLPLDRFPYMERVRRRLEPVVELTVIGGVPNMLDYIREVEVWEKGKKVAAIDI